MLNFLVKKGVKVVNLKGKKVKIEYPTFWPYKVIINSHCNIEHIIKNSIGQREHQLKRSNISKDRNYESYNLSVLVYSDTERIELYTQIRSEDCVKIVL
jgi:putative lipoic acid-binding regulatory protein